MGQTPLSIFKMKTKIDLNNKTIFLTGVAGFIGASLVIKLLNLCTGSKIIGVDNENDYYDPALKQYRLERIASAASASSSSWIYQKLDIADTDALHKLFEEYHPSNVINLAAQAGVRYSITNPSAYIRSNLDGFFNILECCRGLIDRGVSFEHLVYASSSSVYGGRNDVPFKESDSVDNPVSLYAATKKSNELLAHSYSKLYNIPSTGLRFFTVYGPAGRPDMAYFSFTEKLRRGESIDIFNYGNCQRDFTYISDIVDGIVSVIQGAPSKSTGSDGLPIPPYEIYNIGHGSPVGLLDFVHILAEELIRAGVLEKDFDIDAHMNLVLMQPGDVPITYASTEKLERDYGYKAETDLRTGLRRFAEWYYEYYIERT